MSADDQVLIRRFRKADIEGAASPVEHKSTAAFDERPGAVALIE